MILKILLVGGTFDTAGGHASGLVSRIGESLLLHVQTTIFNGGNYEELLKIRDTVKQYDAVLWWPNVPNDLPKEALDVKSVAPHTLLVTSKNNREGKYQVQDIVARALAVKANLMVNFEREEPPYTMQVMDPLGNIFCDKTVSTDELARALIHRIRFLRSLTRMSSQSSGKPAIQHPNDPEFFDQVKFAADRFHRLLDPGPDVKRFLGNASFRCANGFPALRNPNGIYVSKRNVDKRDISAASFVHVWIENGILMYDGDQKPSVDAPVQVQLFEAFPKINYMLHGHVHILGSDIGIGTGEPFPCGVLEEADAIIRELNDPNTTCAKIDLTGHGCLIMGAQPWMFSKLQFCARDKPEPQFGWMFPNGNGTLSF